MVALGLPITVRQEKKTRLIQLNIEVPTLHRYYTLRALLNSGAEVNYIS